MNFAALRYEELAINAFPSIQTEVYDGWLLRFSNGYTYRGNSVNPLYLSTKAYEDKIDYCEQKYFRKNLPCVFKMTENVPSALDQQLAMRGYEIEKKAYIMERSFQNRAPEEERPDDILIDHELTEEWLDAFIALDDMENSLHRHTAKTMLRAIQNPVYCAAIVEEGEIIGCGLGVLEDGKIGLYDIRIKRQYRRRGYAAKICEALLREGIRCGADAAYLQVSAENQAAYKLYRKLGFEKAYTYWYRVKYNR